MDNRTFSSKGQYEEEIARIVREMKELDPEGTEHERLEAVYECLMDEYVALCESTEEDDE